MLASRFGVVFLLSVLLVTKVRVRVMVRARVRVGGLPNLRPPRHQGYPQGATPIPNQPTPTPTQATLKELPHMLCVAPGIFPASMVL